MAKKQMLMKVLFRTAHGSESERLTGPIIITRPGRPAVR